MTSHEHSAKQSDDRDTKRNTQDEIVPNNLSGLGSFYALQWAIKKPSKETLTPQAVLQLQRVVGNQATLRLLSSATVIQRQATVTDLPNDNIITKQQVITALEGWRDSYQQKVQAEQHAPAPANRPAYKNPAYALEEVGSMITSVTSLDLNSNSVWNQTLSVAIENNQIQAVRLIRARSGTLDLIVANPDRDPELGSPGPASVLIDEFGTRNLGTQNNPQRPTLRAEVPSLIPMYQNRFGYRLTDEAWGLIANQIELNNRTYPTGILQDNEFAQITTPRLEMKKPPDPED